MKTLTEKQKNILEFIEEFLDREGMAPTVYEIADHFNIKTSTVFAHLRALQRKKQLSRSSKARSISLMSRMRGARGVPHGALMIPLLGRVNAGAPAESLEYKEGEICVTSAQVNDYPLEQLFALRIQGESMRDLGIFDGDKVIVKKTSQAKDGDIVLAYVDNGYTLKTFRKKNTENGVKIWLQPENPEYPIIEPKEILTIFGVATGIARQL